MYKLGADTQDIKKVIRSMTPAEKNTLLGEIGGTRDSLVAASSIHTLAEDYIDNADTSQRSLI